MLQTQSPLSDTNSSSASISALTHPPESTRESFLERYFPLESPDVSLQCLHMESRPPSFVLRPPYLTTFPILHSPCSFFPGVSAYAIPLPGTLYCTFQPSFLSSSPCSSLSLLFFNAHLILYFLSKIYLLL